jgi:two-component system, LytTR family, sensor kinase
MNPSISIRKLLTIAVYTSTAIGVIAIGPAFIVGITFWRISFEPLTLLLLVVFLFFGMSLFVFQFWCINIGFYYLENRFKKIFSQRGLRWVASYLSGIVLFIIMRLIASPLFNDTARQQEMLNWKLKTFNIQQINFDYTQFTGIFTQLMIVLFVVLSVNTVVIIILEFVLLSDKKRRIENENNLLKVKNIEAENLKLRQQLQPHFLFNSLNVLKTLIRRQPDNAEAYLKRLSDFLRASVSYNQMNTVSITEELKLCIDYMEMQKIRFGNAIGFTIDFPEDLQKGRIPLFAIQTLIENAIKHNAFTVESPLTIQLVYHNGWITVQNNIQPKTAHESTTGMGLLNLAERYRIISGDEISIDHNNTDFSVGIKVLSHEDCNY